MKYSEFRNYTKNYPFFRSNIFCHLTNNDLQLRAQITNWKEKGLLTELKRGMYTLNSSDRSVGIYQL
jgi:hypothetical protein